MAPRKAHIRGKLFYAKKNFWIGVDFFLFISAHIKWIFFSLSTNKFNTIFSPRKKKPFFDISNPEERKAKSQRYLLPKECEGTTALKNLLEDDTDEFRLVEALSKGKRKKSLQYSKIFGMKQFAPNMSFTRSH